MAKTLVHASLHVMPVRWPLARSPMRPRQALDAQEERERSFEATSRLSRRRTAAAYADVDDGMYDGEETESWQERLAQNQGGRHVGALPSQSELPPRRPIRYSFALHGLSRID